MRESHIELQSLSATDLDTALPGLTALLQDAVDGGASLGFVAPLRACDAHAYWGSIREEIQAGSRSLLAAFEHGRIVAAGQLALAPWANGRHRAEVQKLIVHGMWRKRGVGRLLLAALHEAARQRGRSLLVLHTQGGEAVHRFYRSHGYRVAGVIPGYARDARGERHDNTTYYRELAP